MYDVFPLGNNKLLISISHLLLAGQMCHNLAATPESDAENSLN